MKLTSNQVAFLRDACERPDGTLEIHGPDLATGRPRLFLKDVRDHQRVHEDERRLEKVETKYRQLLLLMFVRGDLTAFAEEDKRVGAVPALDDV